MLTNDLIGAGRNLKHLLQSNNEADIPDFIFITPEKLFTNMNVLSILREAYVDGKISRIIIDEVYCFTDWGLTFRSNYLHFNRLKLLFPNV